MLDPSTTSFGSGQHWTMKVSGYVEQQRTETKVQLVEGQIEQRVPEAERQCPKCGNTQLWRSGEKTGKRPVNRALPRGVPTA